MPSFWEGLRRLITGEPVFQEHEEAGKPDKDTSRTAPRPADKPADDAADNKNDAESSPPGILPKPQPLPPNDPLPKAQELPPNDPLPKPNSDANNKII